MSAERVRAHSGEPGASAIRFEGVTKRFGDTVAVRGLDLEIEAGEFFSLLGP
jgi:ABC-type Fe3+/spermidine/putrescine transport system ATPase subunit